MLVTLLVVSMIALIVGQALAQLARVERLLSQGQVSNMTQSLRAEWIRVAIASMIPGAPDSPDRVQGSGTELKGLSTSVPLWPPAGLAMLHLRLDFDSQTQTSTLQLVQIGDATGLTAETQTPLLVWPGRAGAFSYQDAQGRWHEQWPPSDQVGGQGLPRVVRLETGAQALPVLVVVPLSASTPQPTRRQLEGL